MAWIILKEFNHDFLQQFLKNNHFSRFRQKFILDILHEFFLGFLQVFLHESF